MKISDREALFELLSDSSNSAKYITEIGTIRRMFLLIDTANPKLIALVKTKFATQSSDDFIPYYQLVQHGDKCDCEQMGIAGESLDNLENNYHEISLTTAWLIASAFYIFLGVIVLGLLLTPTQYDLVTETVEIYYAAIVSATIATYIIKKCQRAWSTFHDKQRSNE